MRLSPGKLNWHDGFIDMFYNGVYAPCPRKKQAIKNIRRSLDSVKRKS